jgi:hypothetical protein
LHLHPHTQKKKERKTKEGRKEGKIRNKIKIKMKALKFDINFFSPCYLVYRDVYAHMARQRERVSGRNGKGECFSMQQIQAAHDEYDEEATLFVFRLKSLKEGQSRSLLTQAARHHAAQVSFSSNNVVFKPVGLIVNSVSFLKAALLLYEGS